jgi:hypothetical protein
MYNMHNIVEKHFKYLYRNVIGYVHGQGTSYAWLSSASIATRPRLF